MMGLFAKKSFVGIDLGHHQIKAVQIDRTHAGWKISRSGSIATPLESIKDGVVVDIKAVAAAVKQLLKNAHIGATQAHIAAAGGSVFVRPVVFPKMNDATLRKTIKIEAGRYVPGSVEDSLIEFEIIDKAGDGHMNVLVVAAPRDVIETRVAACECAGLEVESVDVESFALHRALVEAEPYVTYEGTIAMVDIGATTTCVSIIDHGIFAMNRAIPHGGKLLTDALVQYFKISESDAEEGKSQLDLRDLLSEAGLKENPPLRVIQPHVDDLIREVRRSLNYYQSQQTDDSQPRKVEFLILTGGGAKLIGLAEYTTKKLGIKTIEKGLLDNPRFTGLPDDETRGLGFAVAAGLAMRSHAKAVGAPVKGAPQAAAPPEPTPPEPTPPATPPPAEPPPVAPPPAPDPIPDPVDPVDHTAEEAA